MRQLALGVGNLVDVEEDRPGNMFGEIFGVRVLAFARHVPRGIDDDEVGRIELAFELVGLGQPCLRLQQIEFSIVSLDEHARRGRLFLVEP